MPFLILVKNGEKIAYRLGDDLTSIGRSLDNTISIDDTKSSRFHCEVHLREDSYYLIDPGSRNGTMVNGALTCEHQLVDGDEIRIGKTEIVFHIQSEDILSDSEAFGSISTTRLPDPESSTTTSPRSFPLPESLPEAHLLIHRLTECSEISKHVASVFHLESILAEILDAAIGLSGAERGFLLTLEPLAPTDSTSNDRSAPPLLGDWKVAAARHSPGSTPSGDPLKNISRSLCHQALEEGRPILTEDASEDLRFHKAPSVTNLRLRSIACFPLIFKTEALGVLYLDHPIASAIFSPDDVRFLESFASSAAISLHHAQLHNHLSNLLDERTQQLEVLQQQFRTRYNYDQIVGRASSLQQIFRLLDKTVPTQIPVIIQGESGTGKELIARAIHANGPRSKGQFVSINCAALNDSLLESELFGHEKGAFTGADQTKKGLFELAHGGTLLLDEVGEMSPSMQSRLLRVLQEGELRRIGAKEPTRIDVRVISATNADLCQCVEEENFRSDLYYRLNGITIEPPPLRKRREDIPLLVQTFLKQIADSEDSRGQVREISPEALKKLAAHSWPGNVRELENEIRRAAAMTEHLQIIGPDDILVSPHIANRSGRLAEDLEGSTLKEVVEDLEQHLIRQCLQKHDGNKTRAAKELGLSRPGLRKKLARYEIQFP